jgi:hypothetical protein
VMNQILLISLPSLHCVEEQPPPAIPDSFG